MSKANRRSIKTAQINLRELNIVVDGADGTPDALGFDRFLIESITDLGVGNYKINFKQSFERAVSVKSAVPMTADAAVHVTAVAIDSVTIQCTDLAATAKDIDLSLCIIGSDHRYDID